MSDKLQLVEVALQTEVCRTLSLKLTHYPFAFGQCKN